MTKPTNEQLREVTRGFDFNHDGHTVQYKELGENYREVTCKECGITIGETIEEQLH